MPNQLNSDLRLIRSKCAWARQKSAQGFGTATATKTVTSSISRKAEEERERDREEDRRGGVAEEAKQIEMMTTI